MESWTQGALLLLAGYVIWLAAAAVRHRRRWPRGGTRLGAVPLLLVVRDIDSQVEGLIGLLRSRLETQSLPDVPVCIVDAGSADLTGSILDRLCGVDSRLQWLRLPRGRTQCPVDSGLRCLSPAIPLALVCDLRRVTEATDCGTIVAASAAAAAAVNREMKDGSGDFCPASSASDGLQ